MKTLEALVLTMLSLLISVLFIAVFIASTGNNIAEVFYSIYRGAFGNWFSWQNTLVRAAPIMLTALCTAIPARIGLVIIGGEGAVVIGGLSATIMVLQMPEASPYVVLTAMMLTGSLFGGIWILLAGAFKQFRGVNETISSLLLSYIAIAILNFLVVGPMKDPSTLNKPSTFHIGEANMLGEIGESSIHYGLIFGVVICILLWFLMRYTRVGIAVDIVGGNAKAAKLVGISVTRLVLTCCFIGGAAAGLAGVIEVVAVHGRANTSLNAGFGYAGILVAFLARHNPLAIIFIAILLGGISASGSLLQRAHDLPDATVLVMQGIIFMVILAMEMFYGRIKFFKEKGIN
jgi:simple sugar transport system permease protein